MVVSLQRNRSVDVVLPLLQNSFENSKFQAFANYIQEHSDRNGEWIVPMQITFHDLMGSDVAICTNGVILAIPAITRGVTISTVTWVVSFEQGIIHRELGKGDIENPFAQANQTGFANI